MSGTEPEWMQYDRVHVAARDIAEHVFPAAHEADCKTKLKELLVEFAEAIGEDAVATAIHESAR